MSYEEAKRAHDEQMVRVRAALAGNDPREAVIAELREQLAAVTTRATEAERKLNEVLPQYVTQMTTLLQDNTQLTREVAGLRYYIAQLERNVTQEERAYAAGVASLMLSQQEMQP